MPSVLSRRRERKREKGRETWSLLSLVFSSFSAVTTQTLLFFGRTAEKYSIALSTPFFPARSTLISIRSANYSSARLLPRAPLTPPDLGVAGNVSRDYSDYYYYLKNVLLFLFWQSHAGTVLHLDLYLLLLLDVSCWRISQM